MLDPRNSCSESYGLGRVLPHSPSISRVPNRPSHKLCNHPPLIDTSLLPRRRNLNNLRRLSLSRRSSGSSVPRLLRVQHGLQLGRGLEAGVVGVLLVEVVVGLGPQLEGQLLEDALEDGVDGLLLGRLAVPDGDEVRVEADG